MPIKLLLEALLPLIDQYDCANNVVQPIVAARKKNDKTNFFITLLFLICYCACNIKTIMERCGCLFIAVIKSVPRVLVAGVIFI